MSEEVLNKEMEKAKIHWKRKEQKKGANGDCHGW